MPSNILRTMRGALFMLLMVVGVITCTVMTLPWLFTMPLIHPTVYHYRRLYVEELNKMYFLYNASLITWVAGTTLTIYSKDRKVLDDQNILMLCNHRTRVDWMYGGWLYASCLFHYPCLSFILKNDLKTWPFFGWCMQMMLYIFLTRHREQDIPRISECLKYLAKSAIAPAVFIFPEGTDLSPSNVLKSAQYAKLHNLPEFEYVLHPKAGGLQVCMKIAKERQMIIHDITIAYQDHIDGKRTSELSLLKGEFPRHIHLFIERINPFDLPSAEDKLKNWIEVKFADKDKLLAEFYEKTIKGHKSQSTVASKQLDSWPVIMHSSNRPFVMRQLFPMLAMCASTFVSSYLFWYSYTFRVIVIVLCIFFSMSSLSIGVDTMEMYGKHLSDRWFSERS